jgi:phosphoadenosine phosphosulfate reductase
VRHVTSLAVAVPDLGELAATSARFESGPTSKVVRWAADEFGDGLVLAASFQDCVLIDVAAQVVPDVEVIFLDTQYHFAETLWYVDQVRERYDLNLRVMRPEVEPDDLWQTDTDVCCNARKVLPLARALEGKTAWMTGLRRVEAPGRADAPIASYDVGRGLVKVNPLATGTDLDVEGYIRDRELPAHPLTERGYASIGCWPCTAMVGNGDDPRSGRWAVTDKIECGLHD